MGLMSRQNHNGAQRVNGNEPEPGPFAGVKRWARYHARVPARTIKIKNPERYLHSHARSMLALRRVLEMRQK